MEVRLIDKEDAKQRVMSNAVFSGYRNILATTARLTLDRNLTEPKKKKKITMANVLSVIVRFVVGLNEV